MSLDEKIIKLRNQKGWSQIDIALKLNISQSAYNKWESGLTKPKMKNLQKLADVFEIDIVDLILCQFPENNINPNQTNTYPKSTDFKLLVSELVNNQYLIKNIIQNQVKLLEHFLKNNT